MDLRSLHRATTHYGIKTQDIQSDVAFALCPVPECQKRVRLTAYGRFHEHVNNYGFSCDSVSMTPTEAGAIQIDDDGRLVGTDEMRQVAADD